jgi:hypothetical protein
MSRPISATALLFAVATSAGAQTAAPSAAVIPAIRNAAGVQLLVAPENAQPTLRIVLPGEPASDRTFDVLFPEHVTVVRPGSNDGERLYMFQPGQRGERPAWRSAGRSLEYERDLPSDVHLLARATLEDDGVRMHYEFTNRSKVAYDLVYAPTDPRLTGILHDARLERTYVHHKDGFDLLASETPDRLTMPPDRWLPARYLASLTAPIPAQRVQHRDDGITYYYKSRPVDQPFIATRSTDGQWIVASVAREAGNVWSNPELTCQHVDGRPSLPARQRRTVEMKLLVVRGSLDDVLRRAIAQRESLQ